jgi:D-alanyl-D-alanine carboxypeptidase
MKSFLFSIFIAFFLLPTIAGAQAAVDLSPLTAQGVAIYGWRNGVPTVLYEENDTVSFPLASLTKLVTAKAVEVLYPPSTTFVLSKEAMLNAFEDDSFIVPGMRFTRDDMLRALLVNSNNAIANQFAFSAPGNSFIDTMNSVLHSSGYATGTFINPSGLDPLDTTSVPNELTPQKISYLLSDIYRTDPFLTSILKEKNSIVTNLNTGVQVALKSTNKLNYDPLYADKIIISKTGVTDLAGQNLAFVTSGEGKYDYVTVVFTHSENRYADGKLILDWLDPVLHFSVN